MEKLMKFSPAALFCAYVVKVAVLGAGYPDVGIAAVIAAMIVGLVKFDRDEQIKVLTASLALQNEKIAACEDHLKKLRSFQDAQKMNAVRPSVKF